MNIIDIASHSLNRQKAKKSFLVIAIVLGCITVVSLYTFVAAQKMKIENQFDEYGANIIVMHTSEASPGRYPFLPPSL